MGDPMEKEAWEQTVTREAIFGKEDFIPNPGRGGGVKHDSGKLRVDLLPVDVLQGVAGILTHGAKKYGDRNWEEGLHYTRCYGAALRHLFAFWRGEGADPESGLLHLDHAICELMFLRRMSVTRPDLDDRPERG